MLAQKKKKKQTRQFDTGKRKKNKKLSRQDKTIQTKKGHSKATK